MTMEKLVDALRHLAQHLQDAAPPVAEKLWEAAEDLAAMMLRSAAGGLDAVADELDPPEQGTTVAAEGTPEPAVRPAGRKRT